MIRRPDVIIVQNPNRPPTQDNMKQVVEMKFPPDPRNTKQTEACKKIAGSENKVVDMQATDGFYPLTRTRTPCESFAPSGFDSGLLRLCFSTHV